MQMLMQLFGPWPDEQSFSKCLCKFHQNIFCCMAIFKNHITMEFTHTSTFIFFKMVGVVRLMSYISWHAYMIYNFERKCFVRQAPRTKVPISPTRKTFMRLLLFFLSWHYIIICANIDITIITKKLCPKHHMQSTAFLFKLTKKNTDINAQDFYQCLLCWETSWHHPGCRRHK